MTKRILGTVLAVACGVCSAWGEEKNVAEDPALLAKEDAEAFEIQGEYSGTIGRDGVDVKVGAQVVALGDGKFRAVGYPGGLPGDGWMEEQRLEAEGTAKDGAVTFEGTRGKAVLKDGVLRISRANGEMVGELKKVHRASPTLGAEPPEGAVVLFDGKEHNTFRGAKVTEEGLLTQGATSETKFQDATIHLEFALSFMPKAGGQGRSNSGCYAQGRYEVQILDSFGLKGEHNECGGIYTVAPPDVNMCFPPRAWQTYDIEFTAARFDESGKKTKNARMTVRHNGVLVHDNVEVDHATTAAPVPEGPEPGPLYIQDHGNPVRFRNIWVVPKS